MEISQELKEKIERNFSNNQKLIERLLALDPNAIEYIGRISQSGISPKKIIEAYENNNIEAIYKLAIKKVESVQIYNELLHIYSLQIASQNHIEER